MCLKTRKDSLPYYSDVDTKIINIHLFLLLLVSVQRSCNCLKKFLLMNWYSQDETKIHSTYEIVTPESVGLSSSELVLGKHSGRHAFKVKLNEFGYKFSENKINLLFKNLKNLQIKKQVLRKIYLL